MCDDNLLCGKHTIRELRGVSPDAQQAAEAAGMSDADADMSDVDADVSDGEDAGLNWHATLQQVWQEQRAIFSDIAVSYVDAINDRFPDDQYTKFSFMRPEAFPEPGTPAAQEYGKAAMRELAEHYAGNDVGVAAAAAAVGAAAAAGTVPQVVQKPALFDADLLVADWLDPVPTILQYRGQDTLDAWSAWLKEWGSLYPELSRLVRLYIILPAHAAEVERGFSVQNVIKTRLRSSLKVQNLDVLMRVSMHGPKTLYDVFDYQRAATLFNAAGKRVPQHSSAGKKRPSYASKPKHSLTEDFDWELS